MNRAPKNNPVPPIVAAGVIIILISFSVWRQVSKNIPGFVYSPIKDEKIGTLGGGTSTPTYPVAPKPKLYQYIEVTDGCGPYFGGACLRMRSGPGTSYPVVLQLRTGIVLKTSELVSASDGSEWYKVTFNEWLRYPERIDGDHYVSALYVRSFADRGVIEVTKADVVSSVNTKHILVDRSDQMLYAYDGETLFMEQSVSTGLDLTPTPRGTFTIYRKSPTRYMQGPVPDVSEDFYDLPGVPWNLYFTYEGGVIHGAYWHDKFGQQWSHGCVNLPPDRAQKLYDWTPVGTKVTVQD